MMDELNPNQYPALDPVDQAFLELGKAYYMYDFENPAPEVLPLYYKITTLLNQARQMEAAQKAAAAAAGQSGSAAANPAADHCPVCGKEVSGGDHFCRWCGSDLK